MRLNDSTCMHRICAAVVNVNNHQRAERSPGHKPLFAFGLYRCASNVDFCLRTFSRCIIPMPVQSRPRCKVAVGPPRWKGNLVADQLGVDICPLDSSRSLQRCGVSEVHSESHDLHCYGASVTSSYTPWGRIPRNQFSVEVSVVSAKQQIRCYAASSMVTSCAQKGDSGIHPTMV